MYDCEKREQNLMRIIVIWFLGICKEFYNSELHAL